MSTQNYYMILKFDSAKVFPYEPEGKFNKKKQNSDSFQHSSDTLFWSHVSNPLHVLCGLRPTKTFKQNSYSIQSNISDVLVDVAKSAKVKFANVTKQTDNKGIVRNVDEIFTGNKYYQNAIDPSEKFFGMRLNLYVNQKIKVLKNTETKDNPNKKTELNNITFSVDDYVLEEVITETPYISWKKFKQHVYYSYVYNSFVDMVNNVVENCQNKKFKEILEILNYEFVIKRNQHIIVFFDKHYHNESKRNLTISKTYYNIICNGITKEQFIHQESGYGEMLPYHLKLVNRSPEQIVTINGEIVVKVDSEILNRIVRTSCTILDGGVLKISNIVPENEFNLDLLNEYNNVKTEKEYV